MTWAQGQGIFGRSTASTRLVFEDSEDEWDPDYWGLTDEGFGPDEDEESQHYHYGCGPIRPRRRRLRDPR